MSSNNCSHGICEFANFKNRTFSCYFQIPHFDTRPMKRALPMSPTLDTLLPPPPHTHTYTNWVFLPKHLASVCPIRVASKSTLTPLLFVFVALLTVVLLYEASSNRRAVKDADLHLRRLEGLILNSEKRTLETLEELDRRTKAAVRRLDMSVEPDVPGLEQSRRRQVTFVSILSGSPGHVRTRLTLTLLTRGMTFTCAR